MVTYVVARGSGGRTVYVSPQMEQLLGYPTADWVEDPDFFAQVVHPEDRGRALPRFDARTVERDTSSVFRVIARDSRVITVRSEMVVRGGFTLGYWVDISELVRLNEELRQAHKLEAVGRLAGGIAHDFNNLLLAQRGYAELALWNIECGDIDALHDDIGEIVAAGERGASLTRQLLAFARRQRLEPAVLDLSAVVADLERLLRPLVGDHIEVTSTLAPEPVPVLADRGQLEQVITNLVINARDAMPNGGTLRVAVASAEGGRTAVLEVADSGVGMDDATQARIFEPFFTTKGAEGTGLGLSTVHGIVTQSGGRISLRSAPGSGTTFSVLLPTTDAPLAHGGEAAGEPAGRTDYTVMLLDDDERVRTAVTGMLELRGYHVLAAPSGTEALEIAREHRLDVLLADLVMPGDGGAVTAERIRELQPQVAVLYMSGYADNRSLPHDLSETRSSFIQKPFAGDEAAAAIANLLRGRP